MSGVGIGVTGVYVAMFMGCGGLMVTEMAPVWGDRGYWSVYGV